MLVIRLQRTGRRNAPAFRVVLADKRKSAKRSFLEVVGHYLPAHDPVVFEFDKERIEHWISKGAQPSNTIARLLTKEGVKGLEKFMVTYTKKEKRKKEEEAEAPAEAGGEAPAEKAPTEEKDEEKPAEEAPAEEAKEEVKEESKKDEEKPAEEEKKEEEAPKEEEKKEETSDKEKKEE